MAQINTQKEHQALVLAVLHFIQQHSQKDISLNDLATIACQSPFHFSRVFQAQTGIKPMAHVRIFFKDLAHLVGLAPR